MTLCGFLPWSFQDQARAHAPASRSNSMPTSPPVDMILSVQKEKAEAPPKDPDICHFQTAPCACAQSSIRKRRCCTQISVNEYRSEEHTSELQSIMRILYAVL